MQWWVLEQRDCEDFEMFQAHLDKMKRANMHLSMFEKVKMQVKTLVQRLQTMIDRVEAYLQLMLRSFNLVKDAQDDGNITIKKQQKMPMDGGRMLFVSFL